MTFKVIQAGISVSVQDPDDQGIINWESRRVVPWIGSHYQWQTYW